jgi:RNA polymerase sigma-70 factor (ECF subfamily)
MPAPDERHLIREAAEGNRWAFRQLVERYMKAAYNIAYGVLRDHDEAEDAAQEAFVRVYRSLATFRGDAEFSTWLYRIVTNLSLNMIRSNAGRSRYDISAIENSMVHATDAVEHTADVRMHVERALHELPTLQRSVVLLRHFQGLSTRQVSTILSCSEGTVKTHLHRGLRKMKDRLQFLKDEML